MNFKFCFGLRYLYEEMEKDGTAKPIQFWNIEVICPSKANFKDGPQYISKVLGLTNLGQIVILLYNPW